MQIHYSCHKNIEGVAPEEGITLSHLPDHDDTETVASLLTEFEQEKTASPLPQDTEDFTALFKEFEREKTMSPLPKNTEDAGALFDHEKNMPPKTGDQQQSQHQLPFTPMAVRRPWRQQRKCKPYGRT